MSEQWIAHGEHVLKAVERSVLKTDKDRLEAITAILHVLNAVARAYAEIGSMEDVQQELGTLKGVKETHLLYGEYDLLAIVETESMKHLKAIVGWRIRKRDHIRSSQTLIAC